MSNFMIGSSMGSIAALSSLTPAIPDPLNFFYTHTERAPLASGGVRALGLPRCTWEWGFLTLAQREALRDFCAGESAEVYIRTRTNEAAESTGEKFIYYQAVMIWPESEEAAAERRLEFKLEFKYLVAQADPTP